MLGAELKHCEIEYILTSILATRPTPAPRTDYLQMQTSVPKSGVQTQVHTLIFVIANKSKKKTQIQNNLMKYEKLSKKIILPSH